MRRGNPLVEEDATYGELDGCDQDRAESGDLVRDAARVRGHELML